MFKKLEERKGWQFKESDEHFKLSWTGQSNFHLISPCHIVNQRGHRPKIINFQTSFPNQDYILTKQSFCFLKVLVKNLFF